jgi:uncharacterized membrane protein
MAEETPSRELLENLVERLDYLERILQAQTIRLYAVERRVGLEVEPRPRPLGIEDAPPDESARASQRPPARDDDGREATQTPRADAPRPGDARAPWGGFAHEARRAQSSSQQAPPPPRAPAREKRDIESVVGGSVFAWAGILAGVLAVAFFLKLAFENDWIGPGMRVSVGALAGLALLGLGERLRGRGMRPYAFVLSGGGLLILYLSIYASYNFYRLLAQPVAFLLMALVTALAVLLSVRLDALAIAILGLAGGFLTPLLITTGQDNEVALFTYVALLDAGVLGVAYFKRWRALDVLSFVGTVLMTLGWAANFYEDSKLTTTLGFVSLFFVLYSLLAVFHNVLPRRRSRWFDLALLAWNATLYFGFTYALLAGAGYERAAPASHALLLSAYFAGLFYAAWSRCREDRLLAYGYVGAAVTFFTAAVAIQLELHWVTVVWAVEGLMLTWAGLCAREPAARRSAFFVFAAAALHWLAFDSREFGFGDAAGGDFVPLFNARALSCAALVAALGASAWLYRRAQREAGDAGRDRLRDDETRDDRVRADERGRAGEDERSRVGEVGRGGVVEVGRGRVSYEESAAAASVLALAANGLAVTLLSLDLSDYFERRKALAGADGFGRAENARQFSISALWSIYGAAVIAYGVRRNFRALRYAGFALLMAATIKVLSRDLAFYAAAWHAPVFNHTFTAFALLVAAYAFAARLYARDESLGEERSVVPVLVVIANVLALVALSAEAAGYFDSGRAGAADAARARDLGLAKQLSLSVIWAVYGAGLLLAGRLWRVRLLRLSALVLLSLTTLKVFFRDLSSLDRVYRIVSFIVLGAILLAVSYLYQKSRPRDAG